MRHPNSSFMEFIGIMGGTIIGVSIDLFGLASTLTPPTEDFSDAEFVTAAGSVGLVVIPTLIIRCKLNKTYEENPKKLLISSFLLYCSFSVLSFVLTKLIESTYEPSLGAFNLPMVLAGGTGACAMTSLGVLSLEPTPRVLVAVSECASSFFQICLPGTNRGGHNPNDNAPDANRALCSVTTEHYDATSTTAFKA